MGKILPKMPPERQWDRCGIWGRRGSNCFKHADICLVEDNRVSHYREILRNCFCRNCAKRLKANILSLQSIWQTDKPITVEGNRKLVTTLRSDLGRTCDMRRDSRKCKHPSVISLWIGNLPDLCREHTQQLLQELSAPIAEFHDDDRRGAQEVQRRNETMIDFCPVLAGGQPFQREGEEV